MAVPCIGFPCRGLCSTSEDKKLETLFRTALLISRRGNLNVKTKSAVIVSEDHVLEMPPPRFRSGAHYRYYHSYWPCMRPYQPRHRSSRPLIQPSAGTDVIRLEAQVRAQCDDRTGVCRLGVQKSRGGIHVRASRISREITQDWSTERRPRNYVLSLHGTCSSSSSRPWVR